MSRWRWIFRRVTRRLWLRTSLIGMLGIAVAILAAVIERHIPWSLPGQIAADTVRGLLNIIASSMLAVTTFSLSVVTAAYASATTNVTPRATQLLIEDRVSQNALSAFIGSFLFAIVGLILLPTGVYGDRGRIVLFIFTIGIIGLIVISLLRWIDHLTRLGRVNDTTARIEAAAREAIARRIERPYLGGLPAVDLPTGLQDVRARKVGYLQHIDTSALQAVAERCHCRIHVAVLPGEFIYQGTVLARMVGRDDDALRAFSIGDDRSFDQDPRFGLVVLAEVASRALSPAVNDSGTAIDVIGRATRLLTQWAEGGPSAEPEHTRVHVPALRDADMLEDAFMLVARDGAGAVEIHICLQKSFAALAGLGSSAFRAAVRAQAELTMKREDALPLAAERAMVPSLKIGAHERPGGG